MNRLIFDTEALNLNNRIIYNVGYCIIDSNGKTLLEKNFVVKQVYDNKMVMSTAYYNNKTPLYTSKMKGRKTKKVYWGDVCRTMKKDIKDFNVSKAYAYNSNYDIGAFATTQKLFKNKINPLNDVEVIDIMDYLDILINSADYNNYCIDNNFVTEKGYLKKSAEVVYGYMTNNPKYIEEHTALEDSKIEKDILILLLTLNDEEL